MAAFSVLYTINIAVSNLSLQLVTVPVGPAVSRTSKSLTSDLVPSSRPSFDASLHHPHLEHLLQGQVHPDQACQSATSHRWRWLCVSSKGEAVILC